MRTRTDTRRSGLSLLGAIMAIAALIGLVAGIVASPADGVWALGFAGFLAMGTLILWQQPRNRIGWLLLATGLSFVIASTLNVSSGERFMAKVPALAEALLQPAFPAPYFCLLLLVILFPSGRADSPGQRMLVGVTLGLGAVICLGLITSDESLAHRRTNPLAFSIMQPFDHLVGGAGFGIVPVLLAVALCHLVIRMRVSSGTTRVQYRWFGWGLTVCILAILVLWISQWSSALFWVAFAFNALPIAVAVAVLRYRLYDIDRVVSRTTSYLIVTGAVIVVYAVTVTLVSRLVPNQSSLPVAAATLLAAAVFRPVLSRVRTFVDRRFDRVRYDQLRTVDAFGQMIGNQVQADDVSATLLATVQGALQPAGNSLWLREVP
jgi:hypothetical protein